MIKNKRQIDGIRKSCHLAADTLTYLQEHVKPGITTQRLNDLADAYIRNYNAVPAPLGYRGYPRSICTSINEVICHGIPSHSVILKEGDIINIDVTTILNGYYGDTSRMYTVGAVDLAAEKLINITQDCLNIGIAQVKPGNQFCQIGKAIQPYATSRGYSVVHQFCGHGTGIQFHEEPQVHHNDTGDKSELRRMEPGMIFTIEPMLNQGVADAVIDPTDKWTARTQDGKLSAQFEHTVLVSEDGVEVLTK